MVRQWQKLFYDWRFSQTTLERDRLRNAGRAFGAKAFTIRTKGEIEPVLREALNQDCPVVVHCVIDKDVNVLPMVPAGASAEEPITTME